jgi:hypothetical protein
LAQLISRDFGREQSSMLQEGIMKSALSATIGLAFAGLLASPVYAGVKDPSQVTIQKRSDGTGTAFGSPAGAHNSPDNVQQVGCLVRHPPAGQPYIFCWAEDLQRTFVSCIGNQLEPGYAMSSDTFIVFSFDAQGSCTDIESRNTSTTPPKQ